MALVLGIDGGGSKTLAAVASDGMILGIGESGASNINAVGEKTARENLLFACRQALQLTSVKPQEVQYVCAGIAGTLTFPDGRKKTEAVLHELFTAPVQVVADFEIALEAAFSGNEGVSVVSGTGSIAFGRNAKGQCARAGGYGAAVSDDGSAAWIGRHAVAACLRLCDIGDDPELLQKILKVAELNTREELIRVCNSQPLASMAKFAPAVLKAGDADDDIAGTILDRAGRSLADLAAIVMGRLWVGYERIPIAMTGGVLQHSNRVRSAFELALRSDFPNVKCELNEIDPINGAIFLAEQALQAN